MADSHTTATPETTHAAPTANPPVRETQRSVEAEVEQSAIAGQRVMRSVGGGSPAAPPDRFAGALGQMQSASGHAGMLRQLQRSYGNSYVGRVIQAKLTVNQPGDVYEQEADRMAAQVMTMAAPQSAPSIQREMDPKKEKEKIQMLPMAAPQSDRLIQREMDPKKEKEKIQMLPLLQRATEGSQEAGANLESQLNSSKGGGSPLSDDVRSFMEPRFGADFSQVRAHTDSEAVQMNRDLNAQAFTHRQDVYFGAGKSPAKDALTAHELTHVVQQTGQIQPQPTQTLGSSIGLTPSSGEKPYLIQRGPTTPAPAAGVTPPSPPVPGGPTAASPPSPPNTRTDDGLVYIHIPRWELIPKEEKHQELIKPFDEKIQLAKFPISLEPPLFLQFELGGHFNVNFEVGVGPVVLTDVAIGVTKTTAILVSGAIALVPFYGPGPLLLALANSYARGFGKLDAEAYAKVNVGAGVSISGSVTPLGISAFDIAKATMGVDGTLGARLQGNISAATDAQVSFAMEGGSLRFQREKELIIRGGLTAALTGYVEGSLLGGLIKGRFSKSIGIDKGFEWTPTGKMNISFANGLTNKDKIITITEEDIKRAGKLINDIGKVLREDKSTGEVSSSVPIRVNSGELIFTESEKHYLEATNNGGGGNPCEIFWHSPGPGLYFEYIVIKDKSLLQDEQKQLEDKGDAISGIENNRLKVITGDIATLDGILLRIAQIPKVVKDTEDEILHGKSRDPGAERLALEHKAKQLLDSIINDYHKIAIKRGFKHLSEHYEKFPERRYLPDELDVRDHLYTGRHSAEWETAKTTVTKNERNKVITTVNNAKSKALAGDRSDWDEMQKVDFERGHCLIEKGASPNVYDPIHDRYHIDHITPVSTLWNIGDYNGSDGQRKTSFTNIGNLRYITAEANTSLAKYAPRYNRFVGPQFTSSIATSRDISIPKLGSFPFLDSEPPKGKPLQW